MKADRDARAAAGAEVRCRPVLLVRCRKLVSMFDAPVHHDDAVFRGIHRILLQYFQSPEKIALHGDGIFQAAAYLKTQDAPEPEMTGLAETTPIAGGRHTGVPSGRGTAQSERSARFPQAPDEIPNTP